MFFQPASVLPFFPLQFFIYKLTYTMLDIHSFPLYYFYMEELCDIAYTDLEEVTHECGLDKDHEEAHKCHCGEEF